MLGKRSRSGSSALSNRFPLRPHQFLTDRHCPGCCTCRKRHQKCDETKPACWNCRLRGVECGGYGVKLTEFTAHNGRDGQMVSKMVNGPSSKNPSGLRQKQKERERRDTATRTASRGKKAPRTDQTFRVERGEASGSSSTQSGRVRPSEPVCPSAPATNNHPDNTEHTSAPGSSHGDNEEAPSPKPSRPSTASTTTTTELMHIFSPTEGNPGAFADYSGADGLDQAWPDNGDPGQHDALPISQTLAPSPWAQFDAYFAVPSFEIDDSSEPFSVASNTSASASVPATVVDNDEHEGDEQEAMRALEGAFVNPNEPVLCPRPNDPFDQYLFGHCK